MANSILALKQAYDELAEAASQEVVFNVIDEDGSQDDSDYKTFGDGTVQLPGFYIDNLS
jgi:hypothetical protein